MNKILLIGGHGNIGSMLMKDRVENNYLVVGRSKSSKNIDIIDYHDIKSIINVIDQSDCRSVALLTAMSKLDDCEKHPLDSTYINIKLPELIAKACWVNISYSFPPIMFMMGILLLSKMKTQIIYCQSHDMHRRNILQNQKY